MELVKTDFLQQLNPVQRDAVQHITGPQLIIAGPGSGKTRVLTSRIAYLIEQGIPAYSILALTFTNKAAREMQERIQHFTGEGGGRIWAGTFHSLFSRILRIEAQHIGYENTFTIYDTDDSKSLINRIIKEMGLDKSAYNTPIVRSRISSAKNQMITPEMYADDDELLQRDKYSNMTFVFEIYKRYRDRCQSAGAMDFDDLLVNFYRLLMDHPAQVLEKYQRRFQYVMVDEFQDTNKLQYEIVKKLTIYPGSKHNISVVGDDAQSIYAFRGATIDNILNFEKDFPNYKVFKLEQNYRSTIHIVNTANTLINKNKKQIQKTIWTEKSEGEKIKVHKTTNDVEEGRKVVDLILELKHRSHVPNNEIAILYRTNAQSRIFEENLRRHNISYKVFGGINFYQRKEIKDLLAYLRLSINQSDEEALKRIINYPRRGIGDTTIENISEFAQSEGFSFWQAMTEMPLGARTRKAITDFKSIIEEFTDKAKTLNAYDMALYIFKQSTLHQELKSDTTQEGIARMDNINALLDGIKEFVESDEVSINYQVEDKSLASYLQMISLMTDLDSTSEDKDYISLMTIHNAKGLEFQGVFIVGMEENLFPSFMSMDTPEGVEEERRLMYVAITRAQEHCHLTYAGMRYKFGQLKQNEPSRFLMELDPNSIQEFGGSFQVKDDGGALTGNYRVVALPKPGLKKVAPEKDVIPIHATDPKLLVKGNQVLHARFGKGTITQIEGAADNKVATIVFDEIENPERKIMLKFAKLQLVD